LFCDAYTEIEKKNIKMANSKELMLLKSRLFLNGIQREVLLGTLLGDATIIAQKGNSNHNIKFEQRIAKREHVDHLYEIFQDWVGAPPAVRDIKGGGAKDRQSVWFKTYRQPEISYYRKVFYPDGKKVVPKLPDGWLTPRVLAYWFMDDGAKKYKSYQLSSNGFTLDDNRLLQVGLAQLGIETTIQYDSGQSYIYVRTRSGVKFYDLVFPFMVPCMVYKLQDQV
jgi:hypothetical protein